MMKKKKLIWTSNIHLQNFLGERGIWPKEEDYNSNAAGYESTPQFKEAMESYHIQQMFYHNK